MAIVLVVDDHPANRELVVSLLAHSGHAAIEASNGVQALEKLRAARPQLIISDILMPAMDGFQLVRELRADPSVADTKVIFYTAHYHERDARKLAAAYGVSEVLVKPAEPERILAAIERALGSAPKPAPSPGFESLDREHMRIMADKLSQKVEELTATNERLAQSESSIRQLNADLERRVADRTAALEAVNRELQAFDYSVSHDLRAPLAQILGFTAALREEQAAELPPEARDLLDRVAGAAQRMDEMISDLLALSLSGSGELQRQPVDVTSLADAIFAVLRGQDPDRGVSIEVERGLSAVADPGLLRTVLENLLGNAWKFTSRRAGARIEMGRLDPSTSPTFFVRDNGAGFDPRHADKLFAPFQRLHSHSEFEGTGVGLATVQRVIHRHGGRIWADSAPDKGAAFFFTLPE